MAETIADIIVTEKKTHVFEFDFFDIQNSRGLQYKHTTCSEVVEALKKCRQVKDAWVDENQVGPFDYDQYIVVKY